jgi:hypothetical protein
MEKKIKITLFLIGIVIVFGGLILVGQKVPVDNQGQEGISGSQTTYPKNLLEGVVKAIDIENKTLILEVKADLIETSLQDKMEKSIKLNEATICEIYHMDTEETNSYEFSEIAVDDNIVVFTIESTYDEINNLEEFTAESIRRITN